MTTLDSGAVLIAYEAEDGILRMLTRDEEARRLFRLALQE